MHGVVADEDCVVFGREGFAFVDEVEAGVVGLSWVLHTSIFEMEQLTLRIAEPIVNRRTVSLIMAVV